MSRSMRFVSSIALGVLLSVGWTRPAAAAGLTCDDIMNMVDHAVPASVVVDTIRGSGTQFTDRDLQCLRDRRAYREVIEAAEAQRIQAAPAHQPAPARTDATDIERGTSTRSRFGSADAIGSDLVDLDADEDAGPAGASNADIERCVRDYKAAKYRTSSYCLYRLLDSGAYPDKDSQIKYYLAKNLQALQMSHAAQYYYMEVIRKGPSDPFFRHALPRLAQVATTIGDDYELLRVVGKVSPDSFPSQARPHIYYLRGREAYEHGELAEAIAAFNEVPSNHPLYPRAQYLSGIISYQRGKLKSAVRSFREVIGANIAVNDPGLITELEDIKDLAIINIARTYYKLQKFDEAEKYYAKVSRDSTYWPQALFERAWTNFWLGDLNATLGLIATANSPFFTQNTFLPDTQYLRALSYFQFCDYNDVERVLTVFEGTYRPIRDEMRDFIESYRTAAGQQSFDRAFDTYFGPSARQSRLPVGLFAEVLRNRDLASLIRHMDVIHQEIDGIAAQTPQWRDTIGRYLGEVLQRDLTRYQEKAGRTFLQAMLEQYRTLDSLLQDSDVLRFELADAQRADYTYKASNPTVSDVDKQPMDFATSRTISYWPFNGEFWRDELAYYRFTERGQCK